MRGCQWVSAWLVSCERDEPLGLRCGLSHSTTVRFVAAHATLQLAWLFPGIFALIQASSASSSLPWSVEVLGMAPAETGPDCAESRTHSSDCRHGLAHPEVACTDCAPQGRRECVRESLNNQNKTCMPARTNQEPAPFRWLFLFPSPEIAVDCSASQIMIERTSAWVMPSKIGCKEQDLYFSTSKSSAPSGFPSAT